MFKIRLLLLSLSLLGFNAAQAASPFVKGSFSAIQQQYEGEAYLIVFWGKDCAYCMQELDTLGELLPENRDIKLITVATDPFLPTDFIEQKMAGFGLTEFEHWVFADASPESLYFDVNPRWRGALPLTFLSDGQSVVRKSGLLEKPQLKAWLQQLK